MLQDPSKQTGTNDLQNMKLKAIVRHRDHLHCTTQRPHITSAHRIPMCICTTRACIWEMQFVFQWAKQRFPCYGSQTLRHLDHWFSYLFTGLRKCWHRWNQLHIAGGANYG